MSFGILFLVRYLQGVTGSSQLPLLIGLLVGGFGLVIGAGVLQQYFKAAARSVLEPEPRASVGGSYPNETYRPTRSRSDRGTSRPHRSFNVACTRSIPGPSSTARSARAIRSSQ